MEDNYTNTGHSDSDVLFNIQQKCVIFIVAVQCT